MARTTAAEVQAIMDVDTSITLDPYISVANELVTELCLGEGYSSTRLNLIEAWLSAHFVEIRAPLAKAEKADVVSEAFTVPKMGFHFQGTKYGQQALLLDTAGNLAALSKRIENGKPTGITIAWLGTPPTEEE